MKQKIAILTFFNAFNYGGDLQCYALQRKLRDLGYDARVMNLSRPLNKKYQSSKVDSKRFKRIYKYNERLDLTSLIKKRFVEVLHNIYISFGHNARKVKLRNERFRKFHENCISFTKQHFSSFSQLYNTSKNLDYTHYIVGSDQVWNYNYPFSIEPYFLTFVDSKAHKISYAASIGHPNIPVELRIKYKEWLKDFSSISLRERQGAEIIKKITKRSDVQTVLDPTLLLSKQEWLEGLSIKEPLIKDEYVLVYLLSKSSFSLNIARKIADKYGYKVLGVTSSFLRHRSVKGVEYLFGYGPMEFVNLFSNAKFVVTNSFHGTAFALNFNIPFITTANKKRRVNSRLEDILSLTSLQNRLIYEGDNYNLNDIINVEFEQSNKVINNEKIKSLEFLVNAINK